jgi:hypothetical protein
MPTSRSKGRYEVRPHPSISGLVTVWWIDQLGASALLNLGDPAVPLFAKALNDYLARHPRLDIQPEGETA